MAKVKPKNKDNHIVYGIHAVQALLTHHPEKIRVLYLQEKRHDERMKNILQQAKKHAIAIENNQKIFEKISHTQGMIALCKKETQYTSLPADICLSDLLSSIDKPPLLLILDNVQDPHNLGACLRSANAAGAHAVIIPKDRAAPLTAAARKVASGAAEFTPVITVTNLAQTLRFLKENNIWIYGLAGEAQKSLYTENFNSPTAFVLGGEEEGLRHLTREHCDELLSIPMRGQIESLNVSVAAGICLFEAVRQRI